MSVRTVFLVVQPDHSLYQITAPKHTYQLRGMAGVPYACAQPYHPGSGSRGECKALLYSDVHGIITKSVKKSRELDTLWPVNRLSLFGEKIAREGKGEEIPWTNI